MKKITGITYAALRSASLTILFVLLASTVFSQTAKFGYINSAELLKQMPEIKEADTKLLALAKQFEVRQNELKEEYNKKIAEYQSLEKETPTSIREMKENEIVDLQNRIATFQEKVQQDIMKKKEELYQPILDKAEKAIQDVAKENGYRYVFDSSMGVLLYADDSDDISAMVKKKLNIQ